MSANPIASLLAFKWRDVEVPIRSLRMSIAHDLVVHKAWGVSGARVENTGIAPTRFRARIPFLNSIRQGPHESWQYGELYPTVFRAFVVAFQKREAGHLQHPEYGLIACKPEELEVELAAESQGGVEVDASWIEVLDDVVQHQISNVVELDVEADDLDQKMDDLRALVDAQLKARGLSERMPKYKQNFSEMMRQLAGVGDTTDLQSKRLGGQVDAIINRAERLQRSIDRAKSALTWPATQNIERMKAAANDIRQKLLAANRDIVLYVVPKTTTVAGLLPKLPGATLTDLMRLNPKIVAGPVVEKGTHVRYYAPRLAA
jgi:hypothetical protein